MRLIYDPALQTIIEPQWTHSGGWMHAAVRMPAASVDLRGMAVSVRVSANGSVVAEDEWHLPHNKRSAVTCDPANVGQIVPLDMRLKARWQPEDNVRVCMSLTTADLARRGIGPIEATFSFTAPRPPRLFPSWHWPDEFAPGQVKQWHPPVPYPADGGGYVWDEADRSNGGRGWVQAPDY